jgi:hypothetical protein
MMSLVLKLLNGHDFETLSFGEESDKSSEQYLSFEFSLDSTGFDYRRSDTEDISLLRNNISS